ncbi:MAG: cupin domain-containing protein [Luteimonas sp.]
MKATVFLAVLAGVLSTSIPSASAPKLALPPGWQATLDRASPSAEVLDLHRIFAADDVPWQTLDAYTRRKVVYTKRATLVLLQATRSGKPHDLNHWHHHDQITHVLDGRVEVVLGREIRQLGPGAFYACESAVPHSLRLLSDRATLIEVFTPPRNDFRSKPWVGSPASPSARNRPFQANELKALVYHWFSLLDRNAPVDDFLPLLTDAGLQMDFPEATLRGKNDFRNWYAGINRTIRSASHDIRAIETTISGAHAVVKVTVDWRATSTTGQSLGFLVEQRWTVSRSPALDTPIIQTYRVQVLNK